MRFNTDEAYDASECGEPIMLKPRDVARIANHHDCGYPQGTAAAFFADYPDSEHQDTDAATLLAWLGY